MSSEKSLPTTFLSLIEKNNLLQLITFNTSATGILNLISVTKGVSAGSLEILQNYESLFNKSNLSQSNVQTGKEQVHAMT